MVFQVAVNALVTVESAQDASALAETFRVLTGAREGVKVLTPNARGVMHVIPDVAGFDRSTVTRGGQEADATAGNIARKLNAALSTNVIVPARKLDADTRTWGVDVPNFVAQVRAFDAEVDALAVVREVVAQVSADALMRGIK